MKNIKSYKIKYQVIGVFFLIFFFHPIEEDQVIKKIIYFILICFFLIDILKFLISSFKELKWKK